MMLCVFSFLKDYADLSIIFFNLLYRLILFFKIKNI